MKSTLTFYLNSSVALALYNASMSIFETYICKYICVSRLISVCLFQEEKWKRRMKSKKTERKKETISIEQRVVCV